ncbi:hypothetical protein Hdeb2414_s0066g00767611 [Helianthus debilis subsp. tardiflorus]
MSPPNPDPLSIAFVSFNRDLTIGGSRYSLFLSLCNNTSDLQLLICRFRARTKDSVVPLFDSLSKNDLRKHTSKRHLSKRHLVLLYIF